MLLLFTKAQKGWSWFLTHAIVEVAKAIGSSFKLVTPAPKPVREMTQLLSETQKGGDTQTKRVGAAKSWLTAGLGWERSHLFSFTSGDEH